MKAREVIVRNRWFILATVCVSMNAAALVAWLSGAGPGSRAGLGIHSFSPGEDARIAGTQPLAFRFSRPAAVRGAVGRPAPGLVTVEPAVEGVAIWQESDLLVFRPHAPWRNGTVYHAVLSPDFRSEDGASLAGPRRFAFRTAPLALTGMDQTDYSSNRELTLRLRFNDTVNANELRKHLSLSDAQGAAIGFAVAGEVNASDLLVRTGPVMTDRYTMTLAGALTGTSGPLGLSSNVVVQRTFVGQLALTTLEPQMPSIGPGTLEAGFSTRVSAQEAGRFVSVEPRVAYSVEPLESWRHTGLRLTGDFEPGKAYAVTFHKGLPGESPSGQLLQTLTRRAYFPDRPAHIAFGAAGRYLSTRGRRQVPLTTVNVPRVHVRFHRVLPNNLVQLALRDGGDTRYYGPLHADLSTLAAEKDLTIAARPNAVQETMLDLGAVIGDGPGGAFLIEAETGCGLSDSHLVVVTDAGIAAKRSPSDLLVWVNSIRTLEPMAGADVRAYARNNQPVGEGRTDTNGIAHLSLDDTGPERIPYLVTVARGNELSFLRLDDNRVELGAETGGRDYLRRGYEAYVFPDRGIYRPGETAHVRALARTPDFACPPPMPVELLVLNPDGRRDRLLRGMLGPYGSAEFEVPWPDFARTGTYTLRLRAPAAAEAMGETRVAVEEFVPPQIAVAVAGLPPETKPAAPLAFTVTGRYLFGMPAARNLAWAAVTFTADAFAPTNWPGFGFGDAERNLPSRTVTLPRTPLDDNGSTAFELPVPAGMLPPSAVRAAVQASVVEAGGRTVTAFGSCRVHPYPLYVGLAAPSEGVLRVGRPETFRLAAVTPDGTAATGVTVRLTVSRASWTTALRQDSRGRYAYECHRSLTEVLNRPVPLVAGTGEFAFTPPSAGEYVLRAEIAGPAAGHAAALTRYAGTADQQWLAWSVQKPERIAVEPDRSEYHPGDVAKLTLKAPFTGKALVTVETDRVCDRRVVTLDANTAEISVPIGAHLAPNAYCVVDLIRPVKPGELSVAHRAVGVAPIRVVVPGRRLDVQLTAPHETCPATGLTVTIAVRGENGRTAPAEVTLAAVDEGICRVSGFKTPDPLAFFHARRKLDVGLFDLYGSLMPERDDTVLDGASAPGGDGDGDGDSPDLRARLNPVRARRFRPVAIWSGTLLTDSNGTATVNLPVPEFTGSLRLMAVAADPAGVGAGQAQVTVRRSLVVLAGLPRFLAPGDRCTMPVQVVNGGSAPGEARLALRCTGPVTAVADASEGEPGTRRLDLPANGKADVSLGLRAATEPGVAALELEVTLGAETYRERFEIPVRPAAASQELTGGGAVAAGEEARIRMPTGWLRGTENYTLTCSALPTIRLGGSLQYLLHYPYGCIEQTVSSAFPLLYLADLAAEMRPGSMGRDETAHFVRSGILRVLSMQRSNGAFEYWPGSGGEIYAWGSVYAAHFLAEAQKAGYDVPAERLDAACDYLRQVLSNQQPWAGLAEDSAEFRSEAILRSYACVALAAAGKPDHGWMARLREYGDALPVAARLNLAAALLDSGRRREASECLGRLGRDPGADTARETGGGLNSAVRQDAQLLSAWLDVEPDNPAVPGLARRLESVRGPSGRWATTQDNAMALLALGKYSRHAATARMPFSARFTVPGRAPETFAGRSAWEIPAAAADEVRIANDGPGPVYYGWTACGVPLGNQVPEQDRRLSVRRHLYSLDGASLDPSLGVRQGDLVVVELRVDSADTTENLVIEDLLPAGFEIENTRLKTSFDLGWIRGDGNFPLRFQDVRDDRLLAFTGAFYGRRSLYYAARAVTAGRFAYPALAAECMYDPDVRSLHGRTEIEVRRQ